MQGISPHIRRGDYLLPENQALFGGICTEDYYRAAMARMQKMHPGCVFYLKKPVRIQRILHLTGHCLKILLRLPVPFQINIIPGVSFIFLPMINSGPESGLPEDR